MLYTVNHRKHLPLCVICFRKLNLNTKLVLSSFIFLILLQKLYPSVVAPKNTKNIIINLYKLLNVVPTPKITHPTKYNGGFSPNSAQASIFQKEAQGNILPLIGLARSPKVNKAELSVFSYKILGRQKSLWDKTNSSGGLCSMSHCSNAAGLSNSSTS